MLPKYDEMSWYDLMSDEIDYDDHLIRPTLNERINSKPQSEKEKFKNREFAKVTKIYIEEIEVFGIEKAKINFEEYCELMKQKVENWKEDYYATS